MRAPDTEGIRGLSLEPVRVSSEEAWLEGKLGDSWNWCPHGCCYFSVIGEDGFWSVEVSRLYFADFFSDLIHGEPRFRLCEEIAHLIARYLFIEKWWIWMGMAILSSVSRILQTWIWWLNHTYGACVSEEIYGWVQWYCYEELNLSEYTDQVQLFTDVVHDLRIRPRPACWIKATHLKSLHVEVVRAVAKLPEMLILECWRGLLRHWSWKNEHLRSWRSHRTPARDECDCTHASKITFMEEA